MSSIESHLSNKPKQVFFNPINIFDPKVDQNVEENVKQVTKTKPTRVKEEDFQDYEEMEEQKKSIQYNHHIPLGGDTNYNTKWQGTAAWMAPEITSNNYGFKADVYSFGIVMYELLTSIDCTLY